MVKKKNPLVSSGKVVLKNTIIPIAVDEREEKRNHILWSYSNKSCGRPTQEF